MHFAVYSIDVEESYTMLVEYKNGNYICTGYEISLDRGKFSYRHRKYTTTTICPTIAGTELSHANRLYNGDTTTLDALDSLITALLERPPTLYTGSCIYLVLLASAKVLLSTATNHLLQTTLKTVENLIVGNDMETIQLSLLGPALITLHSIIRDYLK